MLRISVSFSKRQDSLISKAFVERGILSFRELSKIKQEQLVDRAQ